MGNTPIDAAPPRQAGQRCLASSPALLGAAGARGGVQGSRRSAPGGQTAKWELWLGIRVRFDRPQEPSLHPVGPLRALEIGARLMLGGDTREVDRAAERVASDLVVLDGGRRTPQTHRSSGPYADTNVCSGKVAGKLRAEAGATQSPVGAGYD